MKKIIAVLAAILTFTMLVTSCGSQPVQVSSQKPHIVTTIFPQYDWVREIAGDKAADLNLTLLLDDGIDLHSYQPTTEDMVKISTCDMLIYVGGESEAWIEDALKVATNKDMIVIKLLDVLGDEVKTEELKEGMEHHHDHDDEDGHDHEDEDGHSHEDGDDHDHENEDGHSHEDGDDHDHEGKDVHHEDEDSHGHEDSGTHEDSHVHEDGGHHEEEMDEHVWLSLKHAQTLCSYIADQLGLLDEENQAAYQAGAAEYISKLQALDTAYAEAVKGASHHTLLFGDRFPFRYLVDDYGLDYFAAFSGCSAETEASFETIVFLAGKTDELALKNVMVVETSDQSIAKTVIQNTKNKSQKVLVLDSLQSVTSEAISSGTTYLAVMESNLAVLKEALS